MFASVKKHLHFRLLSKSVKIKTYRTIVLPFVLHRCKTWFLALRENMN